MCVFVHSFFCVPVVGHVCIVSNVDHILLPTTSQACVDQLHLIPLYNSNIKHPTPTYCSPRNTTPHPHTHPHTHSPTHTLTHTHTHPPTHSPTHTLTHTHTHTHTHSHTHTLTHTHTHPHTHSHTHTLTHTHTHTHTHSPTHTLTHTHTHTHTHSPTPPQVDIWALGVTCYELVTGWFPFDGADKAEIKKAILDNRMRPFPGQGLSPQAISFIKVMLQPNPDARPSADALMNHVFVQSHLHGVQLLKTPTGRRPFSLHVKAGGGGGGKQGGQGGKHGMRGVGGGGGDVMPCVSHNCMQSCLYMCAIIFIHAVVYTPYTNTPRRYQHIPTHQHTHPKTHQHAYFHRQGA